MSSTNKTDGKQREQINKLKRAFAYNLFYKQSVTTRTARLNDCYLAVSYTLRDRMQHLFVNSVAALLERESKIVCYLSAEFLMGPHLHNNLVNLGLYDDFAQAAEESGLNLKEIIDHEEEPGLGNGGRMRTPERAMPAPDAAASSSAPRYSSKRPMSALIIGPGCRCAMSWTAAETSTTSSPRSTPSRKSSK